MTHKHMTDLAKDNIKIQEEARRTVETLEDIVDRKERPSGDSASDDKENKPVPQKTSYDKIALMALLVSVIAWAILLVPSLYSGYVSLAVAVMSVVLAAVGLKSKRRGWRDTSVTAMIIGGVLTIVILSFIVVLYVGLKGL